MTAKNRYWDHERCCWVAYESTGETLPATLAVAVPEQRDDETLAAAVQAIIPTE